jgi:hypothetical protein
VARRHRRELGPANAAGPNWSIPYCRKSRGFNLEPVVVGRLHEPGLSYGREQFRGAASPEIAYAIRPAAGDRCIRLTSNVVTPHSAATLLRTYAAQAELDQHEMCVDQACRVLRTQRAAKLRIHPTHNAVVARLNIWRGFTTIGRLSG